MTILLILSIIYLTGVIAAWFSEYSSWFQLCEEIEQEIYGKVDYEGLHQDAVRIANGVSWFSWPIVFSNLKEDQANE